jgi:hypothetical protein
MAALSLYTIKALADVITGGSNAAPPEEAVSPYRTGPKIEQFFSALRVDFCVSGSESRVRAVEVRLTKLIGEPDGIKTLTAVIEQAVDLRHFKDRPDLLDRAAAHLNEQLEYDGWTLQEINGRRRMVAFKGVPGQRQPRGVDGAPKNLIFASNGPKPEIVLVDAINNDVRIVKNAEFCLIYERPISQAGLTRGDLMQWWADRLGKEASEPDVRKSLYDRLLQATNSSVPEKLLFETYYHTFKNLGAKLPVLLPQVYLHYDPRTVKELYGEKRLGVDLLRRPKANRSRRVAGTNRRSSASLCR